MEKFYFYFLAPMANKYYDIEVFEVIKKEDGTYVDGISADEIDKFMVDTHDHYSDIYSALNSAIEEINNKGGIVGTILHSYAE